MATVCESCPVRLLFSLIYRLSLGAVAWLVLARLVASGVEPQGYYASAEGRSGAELRAALHVILTNATVLPYSSGSSVDTSDALRVLDEDPY